MSLLSIIIPTRDRARYVGASIRTALQSNAAPIEVLVLDNASGDDTASTVNAISDPRIRYVRSDRRLSMRDNFERGLDLAHGDLISFIGDDDGILADTPTIVLRFFEDPKTMAVSAARAHYWWPDLLAERRNCGLLPRNEGWEYRNSKIDLRNLLDTSDYYRLPCLYHGFVRRDLIERARRERFFLSSQVDMYSAIALAMEDVRFVYSHRPLVINGGSARSNGASHFGGGTSEEREKWKQEEDLGFLPGFEPHATVGSLIIESALRYAATHNVVLTDIFPQTAINAAMDEERRQRVRRGLSVAGMETAEAAAGVTSTGETVLASTELRLGRLIRSFSASMPIDARAHGIDDVMAASQLFQRLLNKGRRRNLHRPLEQVRTALRIGRG